MNVRVCSIVQKDAIQLLLMCHCATIVEAKNKGVQVKMHVVVQEVKVVKAKL